MKAHPYADLFPMIPESELQQLAADIREHGLRDPIVIYEGQILDGRNRYAACQLADVQPRTMPFRGRDALEYVLSHNLYRRHLTESQRAMVAAGVAKLRPGTNRYQPKTDAIDGVGGKGGKVEVSIETSTTEQPNTMKAAADKLNVGRATVARAKQVIDHGADGLANLVRDDKVSVAAAAEVSRLPVEQQQEIIAAGPDAVKQTAARLRTEKAEKLAPPPPPPPKPEPEPESEGAATPPSIGGNIASSSFSSVPAGHIRCPHCRGYGHIERPASLSTATGMPPIPSAIDTPAFREVWEAWHQERKTRKQAITTRAAKMQLDQLAPLGEVKAIACIEASISNSWTGLFPDRVTKSGGFMTAREKDDAFVAQMMYDALGGGS
jgi:hypothetical protein